MLRKSQFLQNLQKNQKSLINNDMKMHLKFLENEILDVELFKKSKSFLNKAVWVLSQDFRSGSSAFEKIVKCQK